MSVRPQNALVVRRRRLHLTIREAAQRAGVSTAYYGFAERGHSDIGQSAVRSIAGVLQQTVSKTRRAVLDQRIQWLERRLARTREQLRKGR